MSPESHEETPFSHKNIKFVLYHGLIAAQLNDEQAFRARRMGVGHSRPDWNCWVFPSDALTAWRVYQEFKDEAISTDPEIKKLVDGYSAQQEAKTLSNLEDIPGLKRSAWNHQRQAYHFGYNLKGLLLAMGMGTGKTFATIGLIENRAGKTILIICPKSVIDVWPQEFEKHSNKHYEVCTLKKGTGSDKKEQVENAMQVHRATKTPLAVIVNYESAWRDPLGKFLLNQEWDHVIFDECHRVKSASGKASRFCAKFVGNSKYRIGLTGTPMPHSPLDIYAQGRAIDPSVFGTSNNRFKQKYALYGGFNNKQVLKFINQDEMHIKFEQFSYQVGSDVLDLPPVTHTHRTCELEPEARKAYEAMEKELYCQVESGEVTASNALVKLLRLQQIASGYIRTDEEQVLKISSAKQNLLADILSDIDKSEPLVIFAVFRSDIQAIRTALEESGRSVSELSGSENQLKEWQDGETNSIVVQMRSGGVGIDLTRSAIQLYYSVGHSLGDYEQSLARTHRPGQTRAVRFIHLIAENTVDQSIYAALDKKKESVMYVLQTLKEKYRR